MIRKMKRSTFVISTAICLSFLVLSATLKISSINGADEYGAKYAKKKTEPATEKEEPRTKKRTEGSKPRYEKQRLEGEKSQEIGGGVEPAPGKGAESKYAEEGKSLLPGVASVSEDAEKFKKEEPADVRAERPPTTDERQVPVREDRPTWDVQPPYIREERPVSTEELANVRAERPSIYGNPPFAAPYSPPVAGGSEETEAVMPLPKPERRTKPKPLRRKEVAKPARSRSSTRTEPPREAKSVKEEKQAKSSEEDRAERREKGARGEPQETASEKMPHKPSETPHTSPGEEEGSEAAPVEAEDTGARI